jgi:tripartite-type tricarboxylate transporter receptor subunit TctC
MLVWVALLPVCYGWNAAVGPARQAPRALSSVRMAAGDGALIIQNKGGGHGEIGYHLALELVKERGMPVTILHEGPNKAKPPHDAYGDLDAAGVKVIWWALPAASCCSPTRLTG